VLERQLLRWQAELGASDNGGGFLGVVASICSYGVDIAPGTLDGVVVKDRTTAAGLEQAIDGLHAQGDSVGGLPSTAGPVCKGNFLPEAR
jgi:hypothetical protein